MNIPNARSTIEYLAPRRRSSSGRRNRGGDDEHAATHIDFGSAADAVLDDWDRLGGKMEWAIGGPRTIHAFAHAVANQINYFGSLYGEGRKAEWNSALLPSIEAHGDTPGIFALMPLSRAWGQLHFHFWGNAGQGSTDAAECRKTCTSS